MERRFVWERGKGTHRDFSTVGKALNVAIHFVERRAGDVQHTKRSIHVKTGNRRSVGVLSLGLSEHKPICTKPEGIACLRFGCHLVLDVIGLRGSFERHGHAQSNSRFAFAYLPFSFELLAIGVEWSGLQIASHALFEGEQRIAEAECSLPDYVNTLAKDL
jgi:hypothetical protein